ncbi:elongation factor 1-alpha, putative [Entamoeba invadens IP1]|uniref:Elongation factor 1-alpha, putative n=1 Tax=Entamoeba invadens IP1 TaxID=370355 RepID=A0A0A1U3X3_ENTIV|nr:elongation factor 1-alpha, putative [Entamoeba invadens IP1]ELP86322.1 elongation factor 1-alpha, putative [Entamoeba invadens IP1]|eukprot:XP_004185668.1 elongation factor 1-alpha, putative [Entamoeba invadens IP1]
MTGIFCGDVGVLVYEARLNPTKKDESASKSSLMSNVLLLHCAGFSEVIVAINKMDSVQYSQAFFESTKADLFQFFKMTSLDKEKVKFVPVSVESGDNLYSKTTKMPWYSGKSLFNEICSFHPPLHLTNSSLRILVHSLIVTKSVGTIINGYIVSGTLQVGSMLSFLPSKMTGKCLSIEQNRVKREKVLAGADVAFCVEGVKKGDIERGMVVTEKTQPKSVLSFCAKIVVVGERRNIRVGYSPTLNVGACHIPCCIKKLQSLINKSNGEVEEENPEVITTGDVAVVKILPDKLAYIEDITLCEKLAKFVVSDNNQIVAIGVVLQVEYRIEK